jgi:hypothetical protein
MSKLLVVSALFTILLGSSAVAEGVLKNDPSLPVPGYGAGLLWGSTEMGEPTIRVFAADIVPSRHLMRTERLYP